MASNPLNRLFFPILRKTTGDSGRTIKDPIGYFSCRAVAARFLDITALAENTNTLVVTERKAHTRNATLADGTILGGGADGGTADSNVAESKILLPFSSRGSKSVIVTTGKRLASNKGFHTLTFRFPSFCTMLDISEALGEIIPATKMKIDAKATDIFPYFRSAGGRKYPIMDPVPAEERTNVQVAENQGEIQALFTAAEGKEVIKGAGGAA